MNGAGRPERELRPLGGHMMSVLFDAFSGALASALRDRGMALFFLLAVPVYSFFYPIAYSTQAVRDVPVEIVDLDRSPLSRQLRIELAAEPTLRIVGDAPSIIAASSHLAAGTIAGVIAIPEGFERDVLRGANTAVTTFGSGAYPVQDKAVLTSVAAVVVELAARTGATRAVREGMPPAAVLQAIAAGPAFAEQPLYNLTSGYGSYVVAAVAILIVQQILLIGIAGLTGTWIEERAGPLFGDRAPTAVTLAGAAAAFASFALLALLYMIGFVFWFHDYPRGGNTVAAIGFAVLMAAVIAMLGIALGSWFANRERALQVMLATSVPFLFLSGVVFPRESIPAALNVLAALVPTTPAINGFVRLNQMGASFSEVAPEFAHLAALLLLYSVVAWWAVRRRRRGLGNARSAAAGC